MDEWSNFPRERQRLFDLIETTKANGVILLSGNVHFTEISRTQIYRFDPDTATGVYVERNDAR